MTVFTFTRKLLKLKTKEISMKYLICLYMMISSSVFAAGIHKWVDENGGIHYGDKPPVSTVTDQVKVDSAPENPGKALPRIETGGATPDSGSSEEVPADQASAACDRAQSDLQVIKSSSRIKLKNADGSSRYMTTEEIKARQDSAQSDVETFCN